MHGTILSTDQNFAAVICSVIESLDHNTARWCCDWEEYTQAPQQTHLLICHVSSVEEIEQAKAHLEHWKSHSRPIPVLVIGDSLSMQNKVELIKTGALECLDRPVNLRRICALVQSMTISLQSIAISQRADEANSADRAGDFRLALKQEIDKLAEVDVNVLITGETGVGKTWWAKQIHDLSSHRKHPFVAINCGAIPELLVESELFGHKKGSFTGADSNRTGCLAFAGKGTILLDELDALPKSAQAKLLHAVEERIFHPVGSNETIKLQARILAATNKSLEDLVSQGQFRSDLYYRLDVYEINIAPLRERREEIPGFMRMFADQFSKRYARPRFSFSDEATRVMEEFDWPGNLRQLRNCMEHSAINCDDTVIRVSDLPSRIVNATSPGSKPWASVPEPSVDFVPVETRANELLGGAVDRSSRKEKRSLAELLEALRHCNNNRTLAAQELGISRAALYKMLGRFDLR